MAAPGPATPAQASVAPATGWRRLFARYCESRIAIAGLVMLALLVFVSVFAPVIAPQNPYDLAAIDLADARKPPGSAKLAPRPSTGVQARLDLAGDAVALALSPVARSDYAPAEEITLAARALPPAEDGATRIGLAIGARPGGSMEPLSAVTITGLPRGASLSVPPPRFGANWAVPPAALPDLVLTLPPGTETATLRVNATGGEERRLMTFWLGTDDQGRDMLSAILYGLRISMAVAVASVVIALGIGTFLGIYAAYRGGRVDALIMRVVDLQMSFPTILVALILLAILGPGLLNVMLALVIVQWALYARVARSVALAEQGREYVEAARSLGFSTPRILLGHVLPNCTPSLIVIATLEVGHAIALEATLSFLGLGLPITEPSLGLLVSNGFQYLLSGYPWISVLPGIAILYAVLSINLVGDQLRDVLNPRLSQ